MGNRVTRVTLALLIVGCPVSQAATYVIRPDGAGDYPTIQAGIDAAVDGDVIELADGTFRGDGNRDIDYRGKTITVRSQSGNADACVLDCEGSATHPRRGFVFQSDEGPSSVLDGATIRSGYGGIGYGEGGGGILCVGSSPTVHGCIIDQCHARYVGGGINCYGGAPRFESCTFSSNTAAYDGGGGYSASSSPAFIHCTFVDNECGERGGGLACWSGGSPILQDCVFSGNQALGGGGSACVGTVPVVTDCRFMNNISGHNYMGSGGAVLLEDGSNVVFTRCEFAGNTSWELGGGLRVWTSSPRLEGCTFSGNDAHIGGGALAQDRGTATLVGCTISGSRGPSGSGILCRAEGNVELEGVIVAYGGWLGEAVRCEETGTATLSCCDLYGNEGGDWVGCIEDQYGFNGNLSADPLFCHPEEEDFTLHASSPCAPDSNPECGLIGAWPVGCADTPVETTTWGAIKAMFRK